DVTISTTAGSILGIGGGTNITAPGTLSLTALGGTIGTGATPLTVSIGGVANMNATGLNGGVAIAANGTVGSTVPLFPPTVVGAVLFNGVDLNAAAPPPAPAAAPADNNAAPVAVVPAVNTAVADLNIFNVAQLVLPAAAALTTFTVTPVLPVL